MDQEQDQTYLGLTRRELMASLAAAGVGAAALSGVASGAEAAPVEPAAPFQPKGKLTRRPNFLVFMVDEQRAPQVFESAQLTAWRKANLHGQNALMQHGMNFTNHHIMSAACAPSRASFFTGQYPSLHGVTQTTGAAKAALEEDTYWLQPDTVPTMGDYFRAGGYETWYRGKWHVSDADIYIPGTHQPVPSYSDKGVPDPDLERFYEDAGMLEEFGFSGWVGPEPHGSSQYNSGSSARFARGRDSTYARLARQTLRSLSRGNKPWLLVTSLVNPHDISLWGMFTLLQSKWWLQQQVDASNVPNEMFDPEMWAKLVDEDLSNKPQAQKSFRNVYPQAFQPLDNKRDYHKFYYALQETVDKHVFSVIKTLMSNKAAWRDTIILYVSDHGDQLGAHGGLHQKWHQAYDQTVKVPFIVSNPVMFPKPMTTDVITSHADVLPTMLGLAGLSEKKLAARLNHTHTDVRKLPGRDLSGFLLGEEGEDSVKGPVYFMTDDEPTRGSNQMAPSGEYYKSVIQPCHLEQVVAKLPTGTNGALENWKYTRYWDNPAFWSNPNSSDVVTFIDGSSTTAGTYTATVTVKVPAVVKLCEAVEPVAEPPSPKSHA